MHKLLLIILLPLVAAVALLSCGDDPDVKRNITDKYGVVFLADGALDTVNTNFTSEELKEALLAHKWEFGYSFFYDDYKIGSTGEDIVDYRYVYEYHSDGTATATEVSTKIEHSYTYSVSARMLTLTNSTGESFTLAVMAMDSKHMVCDQSLKGQYTYRTNYDPETLTRRIVFYAR